jgi:MurNAc alpha-1-phosphate uridylyltransferase
MIRVDTAMVLAAGLGTRMHPITRGLPKPLVRVGGKALIDWTLDCFAAGGVTTAVVNVHHLADQVRRHLAPRLTPRITISDETARLLETGGGVVKALPLLGERPFYVANTDALTVRSSRMPTELMLATWRDDIDIVLLLHPLARTHGFDGPGDFFVAADGSPRRRGNAAAAPFVFAGMQLLHPRVLAGCAAEPFSMNRIWDKAIDAGRVRGVVQDGEWFHVGTPDAIAATDQALAALDIAAS